MTDRENFIKAMKNEVTKANGYTALIGDEWETAMQFTHRTKKQLKLYKQLINEILNVIETDRVSEVG